MEIVVVGSSETFRKSDIFPKFLDCVAKKIVKSFLLYFIFLTSVNDFTIFLATQSRNFGNMK